MRVRVKIPLRALARLERLAERAYQAEAFALLLGYATQDAGGLKVTIVNYVEEGLYYKVLTSNHSMAIFSLAERALAVPAHVGIWHSHPLPPHDAPPALVLRMTRDYARPSPQDVKTLAKLTARAGRPLVMGITAVTRAPWGFQAYTRFYTITPTGLLEAKPEPA